jgi:hypothetical protein
MMERRSRFLMIIVIELVVATFLLFQFNQYARAQEKGVQEQGTLEKGTQKQGTQEKGAQEKGAQGYEQKSQETKIEIDYNKEDREVGLKRMDIIHKALSPELLEKKKTLIKSIEQDYDSKITTLLQRFTSPINRNTVITHVEINFFDPEFESQVCAIQKTSVLVIVDRNGFDIWAQDKSAEQDALKQIKEVINTTFKIPVENISVIKAPY